MKTGWRKIIFAYFVVLVACVFLVLGYIKSSDWIQLIVWIGNGYFLANAGSKIIRQIKGKGK